MDERPDYLNDGEWREHRKLRAEQEARAKAPDGSPPEFSEDSLAPPFAIGGGGK